MPAGPTPIYTVTFGGSQLPGYVQSDSQPLATRFGEQAIINRHGGILSYFGNDLRRIGLSMILMSRLDNVSDLDHLNDCKDQLRDALAILKRVTAPAALMISDQDRYVNALPSNVNWELTSGSSRWLRYTVEFVAEPFYIATTPVTGTFSGNGTFSLTLPETRETYPSFSIPSGVTAFIATHTPSGKVVNFLRGTAGGTILVRCSDFEVFRTDNLNNVSRTMQDVNYGIRHTAGAGSFSLDITGYAGSGSVTVSVSPRYEL